MKLWICERMGEQKLVTISLTNPLTDFQSTVATKTEGTQETCAVCVYVGQPRSKWGFCRVDWVVPRFYVWCPLLALLL